MDDFTLNDIKINFISPTQLGENISLTPREETLSYLRMYARQMQQAGNPSAPIARG